MTKFSIELIHCYTYKSSEISTKPSVSMKGRPCPCCYDFKYCEITARGDWGVASCRYDFILSETSAKGREY